MAAQPQNLLSLQMMVKWRGSDYSLSDIDVSNTSVGDIKRKMHGLTRVDVSKIKLIGLGKALDGSIVNDSTTLSNLKPIIKKGLWNLTMMGTPDEELAQMEVAMVVSQAMVMNDFSHNFTPSCKTWELLSKFTATTEINFISDPRPNKKLLVLDLDHTILDFTSSDDTLAPEDMKRPFMDQFLTELYPYYDIAIWSQTHWKWVEIKLTELGMFSHPGYRICFVLDKSSMFSVETGKVKPLHIIWEKHSSIWSRRNTIHIDDLSRNFELNKENGVTISPFYRKDSTKHKRSKKRSTRSSSATAADIEGRAEFFPAPGGGAAFETADSMQQAVEDDDCELHHLLRYLLCVAEAPDLSAQDHSNWRKPS